MAMYEYKCTNEECLHEFEKIVKVSQRNDEKKCPKCNSKSKRKVSKSSFQFKGSGFYTTDYGGKNASSSGES